MRHRNQNSYSQRNGPVGHQARFRRVRQLLAGAVHSFARARLRRVALDALVRAAAAAGEKLATGSRKSQQQQQQQEEHEQRPAAERGARAASQHRRSLFGDTKSAHVISANLFT